MRPLGSEKLQGEDKIKRILEIANYQNSNKPKKTVTAEFISESVNGYIYGIVREKDGYYVKKGLNESSLDYIGGMFMKNKNKFHSYSEALKRLNLITGQEALNEEKRYVLKKNKPMISPDVDNSATPEAPPPPADELGDLPPVDDQPDVAQTPTDTETDINDPLDDGMNDDTEGNDLDDEEGMSDEPELRSSYMEEIQKFAGKLGQELRDQREKLESDDIKYVLNMIISAIDINALDDEDLEDIVNRLEKKVSSHHEMEDEPDLETEPEHDEELAEGPMDSEANVPPASGGHLDISKFADLKEQGYDDDDDIELDLDEMMKDINKSVNGTLSKYFK